MTSRRARTEDTQDPRDSRRARRGGTSRATPTPAQTPVEDPGVGYLFPFSPAEVQSFISDYLPRRIFEPKRLDADFFTNEGLNVPLLLEDAHLLQLAQMSCPYSENMVRAFYKNLIYRDNELRSKVCGIDIVMSNDDWFDLLGYDFDADEEAIPVESDHAITLEGYDRAAITESIVRQGVDMANYASFNVGILTVEARILHYIMTHIIFQRVYNHSRVLENDLVIMWALRTGTPVNWRHYICSQMVGLKRKKKGQLTHAFLVQKILNKFAIPMEREEMITKTGWNNIFGERLFVQCGMQKVNGIWQWKVGPPAPDVGRAVDDDDVLFDVDDIINTAQTEAHGHVPEAPVDNDVMTILREMRQEQRDMREEQRQFRADMTSRMDRLESRFGNLGLRRDDDDIV